MKNTFFLFAIILLLAACSKDKKTTPAVKLLDVTGSWSTYSQDDTFFTLGNVTADQFPCIADNVITFNPDSSYTSKYIGANVCWITPQHGGNGSISFGDPANAAQTGAWRRNGNDIYIGKEHYVVSNVNNKLVLNYNTSLLINGTTYTVTAVFYKK